jgi:hypothetical protein
MKKLPFFGVRQWFLLALPSFTPAALIAILFTALPTPVRAQHPGWWVLSGSANNSAAVNEGQLKWFTQQATNDMAASLPIGSGTALSTLVSGWINQYQALGYSGTNPMPTDFAVMRVGQLKYIGSLIWKQLQAVDYVTTLPAWLVVNPPVDNHAANIGQLKTVFNFDLATTGTNGLPNWWCQYYFGTLNVSGTGADPSSDGLTNLQCYQAGVNPMQPSNPAVQLNVNVIVQ